MIYNLALFGPENDRSFFHRALIYRCDIKQRKYLTKNSLNCMTECMILLSFNLHILYNDSCIISALHRSHIDSLHI